MSDRIEEIRAYATSLPEVVWTSHGRKGVAVPNPERVMWLDLLSAYDEANADGLPAKTWRAMWNGLRGKLDELRSELAAATERAERAEALAADRGERFARMHADRDAWKARADAAEALAASSPPLSTLPTEFVGGRWVLAGEDEPDAVVTYASEPSPETGHVGWCWWAHGKMGEAADYIAARESAESVVRARAAKATTGERG